MGDHGGVQRPTADTARKHGARTDVAMCLSAARRLRSRHTPMDRRECAGPYMAVTQLLEALAFALARDPASVPMPARHAARRLAHELLSQPAPNPPHVDLPSPRRSAPGTAGNGRPPFTASIELGRMG